MAQCRSRPSSVEKQPVNDGGMPGSVFESADSRFKGME